MVSPRPRHAGPAPGGLGAKTAGMNPARRKHAVVLTLIALGLSPLAFAFGPKLFAGAMVAAVPALVAARLLNGPWPVPRWPDPSSLVVLGLLAWAALSMAWSPWPERSLVTWQALALVAAVAVAGLEAGRWTPSPAARLALFSTVLGVVFFIMSVYVANYLTGMPLYWMFYDIGALDKIPFTSILNRGLTFLVLVAWPLIAWLAGCRAWGVLAGLLAGLATTLLLGASNAALMALAVGIVGAALGAVLRPRTLCWGLRGLALLAALAGPWLLTHGLAQHREGFRETPHSVLARLEILALYAYPLGERPVLGWGIGTATEVPRTPTAPKAYVGHEGLKGGPLPADAYIRVDPATMAVHPHNNFIELWLDLGVVGVALPLVLAWWSAGRVARLDRREDRASAAGAFAGVIVVAATAYGVWQEDWLAQIVFVALLFRLGPPGARATASEHPT